MLVPAHYFVLCMGLPHEEEVPVNREEVFERKTFHGTSKCRNVACQCKFEYNVMEGE